MKKKKSGPPPKMRKLMKDLEIDMRFNDDFEERKSRREAAKSIFDRNGFYRTTGKDECDCLIQKCDGCHFPCPKCESSKCGDTCRRNRNDVFLRIEKDGNLGVIHNKNYKS